MESMMCGITEIRIGRNLLEDVLPERERSRAVVLTQPGAEQVGRRLAARLGAPVRVLPDGEGAKSLSVAEETYRWLDEVDVDRHGTLVAVGGGTVSDLAGFVASTYLRGIELVTVPTTLLAAVDASIGGKTAVNLEAKNLVGTFWEPTRVIVDLDLLDLLPKERIRDGMAEIVKAGFIGDEQLVSLLERDGLGASLSAAVRAAVAVKAGIVSRDPREHGERALLNYGHTVGHAIERVVSVSHGEAVAVGMVVASVLSERMLGFRDRDRHRALIERLELPTAVAADLDPVLRMVRSDKKRIRGGMRMVLLERIGSPLLVEVPEAAVSRVLSDTLL